MDTLQPILDRYPGAGRDALIPILQTVQEAEGFLSPEAITRVGKHLGLPASKVFGVATFYNQFRFQPLGKYHIQVCRGTACHVKGSLGTLETLQRMLDLKPGSTTRDGLFSLETVACLGACGLAPVVCVNGEFFAGVTPDTLKKLVDGVKQREVAHAASH
jgi:NADH-quinone oxidoreductase E subunit